MREFGLLIKNQLTISLKKSSGKGKRNSRFSGAGALVVVAVLMAFVVWTFSVSIAEILKPAGLMRLLPSVMMATACVFCLITSVYKVNGLLFGFKDYELLMSLPIPARTVVSSRIFMLYVYNMFYVSIIIIPSTIVYCSNVNPPAAFYPIFIICLICVPMIPVIIATVIGTLIAYAASFFKRKTGANVAFTVIFLVIWLAFCMSMDNIVEGFAQIGPMITDAIYRIYPFALWYTQAICDYNIGSLILFAAVSVVCWLVFAAVIGKKFAYLNSAIISDRSKTKFTMRELKTATPDKALFQREVKRLTSSSPYFLNAGIGPIISVIFSVIICVMGANGLNIFFGGDDMEDVNEMLSAFVWAVPFFISWFNGMIFTTACSISLEGNKIWIVKSLPVTTKQILTAKLKLNLFIGIPASLLSSVLIMIGLKPPAEAIPAYFLLPVGFVLFSTTLGMVLNLSHPVLNWDSIIKVVKQSTPVMIMTFVDMGIGIAGLTLSTLFGGVFTYCVAAALYIISALLYRNIMTKGVVKFDRIEG